MAKLIGTGQLTLTDLNDVIASSTAPNNPIDGAMWWNTTENKLYIYSNGGWVFSSDGMIFGGVNLLRNSSFNNLSKWSGLVPMHVLPNDFLGSTSARLTRTNWTTGMTRGQFAQAITLIPFPQKGYQYTYSAWVYVDSSVAMAGGANNDIAVRVTKVSDGTIRDFRIADLSTVTKDKWVYVKGTFTLVEDINKMECMHSINQNGLIKVSRPQLETGNIASNWSPAPEDTDEVITDITETLGNMADDNTLDYNERQIIKDKLTDITGSIVPDAQALLPAFGTLDSGAKGTFYTVRKQAQQIGISTAHAKYKLVETNYTYLKDYLDAMTPVKPWDISVANKDKIITVVKGTFRDKWLQFYLAVDDLATYTIQVAKENVDNAETGGTNYASNGSFEIPLAEGIWSSSYSGDIKEIVDISTEEPPFKFAYHVKNTANKNGGIFVPALWSGKACEALVNREVTIQYWLKYSGITQGAQTYLLGRFGELVIEGEDAGGVKKYRYPRIHSDGNVTETLYISGTNTTWKKYTATIKLSLPAQAVKLTKISFKHGLEGCTGEFWTTGIKVEFGNKASDWSQSPFDLENRIYKTEFAVKPDQITSTVTSHQTFITKLNDKVDGAVGAIQVGNGNMIDNSDFRVFDGWRQWGTTGGSRTLVNGVSLNGSLAPTTGAKFVSPASGEFGYAKDAVPVIKGEQYVLSAWVFLETAGGVYTVQEGDSTVNWTSTTGTTVNGWSRVVHKFTARANTTSIYVGQHKTSPISTMTVTAVQLERGNIPSEWGLSMNDIQWGGGRNLLRNSNFARNRVNDSLTWDKELNGNIVPDGWWSNGYNTGVQKPLEGYHAHLNVDKFGYPVAEFIDRNSNIIVDATKVPPVTAIHRWLGMSNTVLTTDPLFLSLAVGKTYTISMDVMSDTVGVKMNTGFHHFITGNATQGFYGFQWDLQTCVTPNVWEKKYKTFTIDDKWDLTKGFAFYLYGQYNTAECSMWVRNVKIEEGTKYTDWSQTPEDVDAFMYNLADRVTSAEEKITDSAIINTVTQSTSYRNDLQSKANSSDLKGYATTGELDKAKNDANKYADDKVSGIDFTPYVVKSEMQQQIDNVTVKFEQSGGVNLLRNSIGFADFSFWKQAQPTFMTTVSNNALEALGFGKGFYFFPSASASFITQDVYVTAGQPYTLSWYMNKTNASPSTNGDGIMWVQILEGATTVASYRYNSEVTTKGFEKNSYVYTPKSNIVTIRVYAEKLADATVSGLMFNIGNSPLQWSMATGEIYNTNIRMDMNGIRVSQIVDGKDRGYTQITPDEFAGYYDTTGNGVYEKVFYLKEDETVSKKFRAKDEFTMGGIKIIKIESTASKGWAFVQSLD